MVKSCDGQIKIVCSEVSAGYIFHLNIQVKQAGK